MATRYEVRLERWSDPGDALAEKIGFGMAPYFSSARAHGVGARDILLMVAEGELYVVGPSFGCHRLGTVGIAAGRCCLRPIHRSRRATECTAVHPGARSGRHGPN